MAFSFNTSTVEMLAEPFIGTVEQVITRQKSGRVKAIGSYWPAQFYQTVSQKTIFPKESVKIVAIQGITLLVVPVNYQGESYLFPH